MDRSCSRWVVYLLTLVLVRPAGAGQADLESEVKRLLDAGEAKQAVETVEARCPASDRDAQTWFLLAEAYHVMLDEAGMLRKRGLAKKMRGALEAARQDLAELER